MLERFVHGPLGVEHTLELRDRPEGDGPVVVEIDVAGLSPRSRGEAEVAFVDGRGRTWATYGGLFVEDAEGRRLGAHMEVSARGLRIVVVDDEATYPVLVDPLLATQTGTLTAAGWHVGGSTGASLALSADGVWAIAGAPGAWVGGAATAGAAIFFRWNGAAWEQDAVLVAPIVATGTRFGNAVALSGDGSRALIGSGRGSAWVFVRDGRGVWAQEGRLARADGAFSPEHGAAVALSGDGMRALVGDPADLDGAGSARVFVRDGSGAWTEEAVLEGSGAAPDDHLGTSVSLSADGQGALVGAPGDDTAAGPDAGSARVFVRDASGAWTEQALLEGMGAAASDDFGRSVALTADGGGALVGVPRDDTLNGADAGSARVFVRSGSGTWTEQATLEGSAATSDADDRLGASVSFSADGSRALVGAPRDDHSRRTRAGSARAFSRDGSGAWTEEATLTLGAAQGSGIAGAVALSGDGGRALVGAPGGSSGGSAHVFTRGTGGAWSATGVLETTGAAVDDEFGVSVALSGDGIRALVGDPNDDTRGVEVGSARVFTRDSMGVWTEEGVLQASDGVAGDRFGETVALSRDGTRALVGAPLDDTGTGPESGTARVFTRDGSGTWTEEAVLEASAARWGGEFGRAVSLSDDGTRALVGAPWEANGAAYFFRRDATGSWTEESVVRGSGRLGVSVSLSGDGGRAVIGASGDDTAAGVDAGRARVYVREGSGTWTEEAVLEAVFAGPGELFGLSVSASRDGTRALIGAPLDDTTAGVDAGSARLFVRSGGVWAQEAVLEAPDAVAGDYFGFSVSLTADATRALIGAPRDDTADGPQAGTARVFSRGAGGEWAEDVTLRPSGAARDDRSGSMVSLSRDGARALLAAPLQDTVARNAGAAMVFDLSDGVAGACTSPAQCATGFCVDGVCCESACGGQCEACGEAGLEGSCVVVRGAPRGDRAGCGSGACGGTCDGALASACVYPGSEVSCGGASCSEGVATAEGRCNGAGGCVPGSSGDCLPYACGAEACLVACTDDAECVDGYECDGGACVPARIAPDAGPPDAGPAPVPRSGCDCRASARGRPVRPWLLALLLAGVPPLRRRRDRALRRRSSPETDPRGRPR